MNKQEPIHKTIAKAKLELSVACGNIQKKYAIPNFLLDLILSSQLAEIRGYAANDETIQEMQEESKDQNKSAVSSADHAEKEVN